MNGIRNVFTVLPLVWLSGGDRGLGADFIERENAVVVRVHLPEDSDTREFVRRELAVGVAIELPEAFLNPTAAHRGPPGHERRCEPLALTAEAARTPKWPPSVWLRSLGRLTLAKRWMAHRSGRIAS